MSTAHLSADHASLQAFIHCYTREIDAGVWHHPGDWQRRTSLAFAQEEEAVLELQLTALATTLAIGISYRSRVGCHCVTQVYQQQANPWEWKRLDGLSTILLLVDHIYLNRQQQGRERELLSVEQSELMARCIDSHQLMLAYLDQRQGDPRLTSPAFIDSEQSLLLGHWQHPTPKSRQGIQRWQQSQYAPELCGEFQLHYFAAPAERVSQASLTLLPAADIIRQQLLGDDAKADDITALPADWILLPVHPLQAQWLSEQDYVQQLLAQQQLLALGPKGRLFTATSSVRTVYNRDCDYMVKLSIPVKITNSLRINMVHELDAGVLVGRLLRDTLQAPEFARFSSIEDPAYVSLQVAGLQQSGFETILRHNPFGHDDQVQSIAALTQASVSPNQPSRLGGLIMRLAEAENRSHRDVALQWFDAYWECAMTPALTLYETAGIALEAHQQNSLLDVSQGYPSHYYYRDNQGFYLSHHWRKALLQREPALHNASDLFYSDEMIRDRFSYYLIVNQLFSVIYRLACDGWVDENTLLIRSRQHLERLAAEFAGTGYAMVQMLLDRPYLPFKANLLTRLDDMDELQAELELAVYRQCANPLSLDYASQLPLSITEVFQREAV